MMRVEMERFLDYVSMKPLDLCVIPFVKVMLFAMIKHFPRVKMPLIMTSKKR